jgi:Na+/melibiose symporter-like transporter
LLEERIENHTRPQDNAKSYKELAVLRNRGLLANTSIALLTLCAFCIGITIIVLFLGETVDFTGLRLSIVAFLAGIVCFLLALACFLAETLMATRLLNFAKPQSTRN